MTASVLLAHPYEKSFNHAIYSVLCSVLADENVAVHGHDLYAEGFNPVLTRKELGTDTSDDPLVNRYTDELLESELLFFVHPNWWGQPPALLKGYIDRVVRPPYAYDFPPDDSGGGLPVEKLCGKYGIVYNTSNTDEERENTCFGDPLENIWKECVFGFCGIRKYHRRMFRIVADSSMAQRRHWLKTVEDDVRSIVHGREPLRSMALHE
ncbi:MAG: NAD(P)H-dependent oxidoreductase [Spirochaetota bacterium]